MWELNHKEGWVLKNWCFQTVVLERTLESSLDCKAIKPVHPKGNQSWVFNGTTDVEAEAPILWPPDVKRWLIWKDPNAGKDWWQEEKGRTEDDRVFSSESVLCIRRPTYWSFSFSINPMNIQHWFPLRLTGLISLMSKGLSRVFSSTTIQKHQFFNA